ncbi:MAG: NAD(P)H-binding protein, partial [Nocardioidaceae bacterium]
ERVLVRRGDQPVGLVRNPDHVIDVEQLGATAVVIDLESCSVDDLAAHLQGAGAVVFAAGAGPGSGAARKETVDRGAAVLLADAAARAGVRRYLMVSAIGADTRPEGRDEVFVAYLEAKAAADAYVRGADLDWTIVRPGSLTNDAATGLVTAAEHVERSGIPRADVAGVVAAALDDPGTVGKQFEVVAGTTPIPDALEAL